MNIIRNLIILITGLMLWGCNPTEQTSIEKSSITESRIRTETFTYSAKNVEFIQNTTASNLVPNKTFKDDTYFYKVYPDLPSGLKINTITGEIAGVPTVVFPETTFLVEADGITRSQFAYVTLSVIAEPPKTINYLTPTLNFTKDVANNFTATTTGGSVTSFNISPSLPAGLNINSTTGEIFGTPTTPTAGLYTVTASNSSGSASTTIYININDIAPAALSYTNDAQVLNVGDAFTGMVPSLSTSPYSTSYTINPKLPSGLTLNSDGSITGTPTETHGINTFTVTAYNSAGSTSAVITITVNNPATGLSYPVTAYEVQQDVPIAPLSVQSYTGGTPVTYSCTGCPAGINLNSTTGLITGTIPNTTPIGVYPILITATHAGTASSTNATINLNLVENYPEDPTNMGYIDHYQLYEDQAFSITPSKAGGMPTLFSITPNIVTTIPGMSFNALTGEISGTPTSPITTTSFTITGYNLDETSTSVIRSVQTIDITVTTLPPTMLGYTPSTSPFYNATTKVFELQDGSNVPLAIQPNITAGGVPTSYTVSPQLPNGLTLNPLTGEITGVPNEIKPIKYYTITGTNSAGSFKETLAISTNTLIAPISLSYGSGTNTLNFTIYNNQIESPDYAGSQGTFSVSPDLPSGLSLNPQNGQIFGTPLVGYAGPKTFDITVTNLKGTLTTSVDISITNSAPANLVYEDASGATNMTFNEGDVITNSDIIHYSDYDNNYAAGFITTYVENGTTDLAGAFGLNLNATSGDITGTATATDPLELNPPFRPIQIDGINAIGTASANFNFKILELPPQISYNNKTNIVVVQGTQTGDAQVVTADNDGGNIAQTSGGVPGSFCTPTIQGSPEEAYDIDAGNFTFDDDTCSFTFNGNQCFNDDTGGDGSTGDSISFEILAQNSGSVAGESTPLTVHFYDGPNFDFLPDSEFPNDLNLVLNGATSGTSYAPDVTNRCHVGDYSLSELSDLPTPFSFNATTGAIQNLGQNILGKRSFILESSESNSGLNLTQTENISVQSNHIENHAGVATHLLESSTYDINLDGYEDIIIRNTECDDKNGDGTSDGPCAAGTVSTSIYLQSPSQLGLLQGTIAALPVLSTLNAVAFTPLQYDASKAGVLYVNSSNTNVVAVSATDTETSSTALATAGYVRGIVPMSDGISSSFGVVLDTGASVTIDQFDITGGDMNTIAASTTASVAIQSDTNGGIDLGAAGAIQLVRSNDTNGDGSMDAVIGYLDATDSNKTKICVLPSDGASFQDTCSPRLEVPNSGNIIDIKFADITGDTLDELVVLANDGANSTIYVYENQNNTFTGLYQAIDLLTLNTNSVHTNFDIADANKDGLLDIVANDLTGDIDNDSTDDSILSGLSVYYNTGNISNLFRPSVVTKFPTALHYSFSAGHNNDIEVIEAGTELLIFHCQIDTDAGVLTTSSGATITSYQNSSCGIIGSF